MTLINHVFIQVHTRIILIQIIISAQDYHPIFYFLFQKHYWHFCNKAIHKIFCMTAINFRALYDMEQNDKNPRSKINHSSLPVLMMSEGTGAHFKWASMMLHGCWKA